MSPIQHGWSKPLCGLGLMLLAAGGLDFGALAELGGPLPGTSVRMAFEPNRGQVASEAAYFARGQGYSVGLKADEAMLVLQQPARLGQDPSPAESLRLRLLGANPVARSRPQRGTGGRRDLCSYTGDTGVWVSANVTIFKLVLIDRVGIVVTEPVSKIIAFATELCLPADGFQVIGVRIDSKISSPKCNRLTSGGICPAR